MSNMYTKVRLDSGSRKYFIDMPTEYANTVIGENEDLLYYAMQHIKVYLSPEINIDVVQRPEKIKYTVISISLLLSDAGFDVYLILKTLQRKRLTAMIIIALALSDHIPDVQTLFYKVDKSGYIKNGIYYKMHKNIAEIIENTYVKNIHTLCEFVFKNKLYLARFRQSAIDVDFKFNLDKDNGTHSIIATRGNNCERPHIAVCELFTFLMHKLIRKMDAVTQFNTIRNISDVFNTFNTCEKFHFHSSSVIRSDINEYPELGNYSALIEFPGIEGFIPNDYYGVNFSQLMRSCMICEKDKIERYVRNINTIGDKNIIVYEFYINYNIFHSTTEQILAEYTKDNTEYIVAKLFSLALTRFNMLLESLYTFSRLSYVSDEIDKYDIYQFGAVVNYVDFIESSCVPDLIYMIKVSDENDKIKRVNLLDIMRLQLYAVELQKMERLVPDVYVTTEDYFMCVMQTILDKIIAENDEIIKKYANDKEL